MTFFNHLRNNRFCRDKRRNQIDIDNFFVLFDGQLRHRHAADDACVVYKDIDNAQIRVDFFYRRFDIGFIGNVAEIRAHIETRFFISGASFFKLIRAALVKGDFGTRFRKRRSDCKADAVRSARYPRRFSGKRKRLHHIHLKYLRKNLYKK